MTAAREMKATPTIGDMLKGIVVWPQEEAKWLVEIADKRPDELSDSEAENAVHATMVVIELLKRAGKVGDSERVALLLPHILAKASYIPTEKNIEEIVNYWELARDIRSQIVEQLKRRGLKVVDLMRRDFGDSILPYTNSNDTYDPLDGVDLSSGDIVEPALSDEVE